MEKCPKCEAPIIDKNDEPVQFRCSSLAPKIGWFQQSIECKDRQIANLTAQLDRANRLMEQYHIESAKIEAYVEELENKLAAKDQALRENK